MDRKQVEDPMGTHIDIGHLINNIFSKNRMTRTGLVKKYTNFVKAMAICCGEGNCEIKNILDIGANMGVYSYSFAFWFPNSFINSFEPVPGNYKLLKQHIDNCEFKDRIKCHRFGFYKEEKDVVFGIPSHRGDLDNTGLYTMGGEQCTQSGRVVLLSDWIQKQSVYPDLIKIDAEGVDFDILNSSKDELLHVKWITVEASDSCSDLLIKLGFVEDKKFRNIKGINFNRRTDSLWRNSNVN